MKTLLQVSFAALCLLPAVAPAAPPVQAPTQAPKSALGPMQAPAQAPTQAPLKTARADSGYRSYSYQPGTMTLAPSGTYRSYSRQPRMGSGFHAADWKANGQR